MRGQWLDAWHASLPGGLREDTQEIGVILEDDLELSPFAWRWLKAAHAVYAANPRVAGFSLMRVELCAARCPNLDGGPDNAGGAFFYPVVGTWGYAPTAKSFARFRRWYYSLPPDFKPYVDGITPTDWYQNFEKAGTEKKVRWGRQHGSAACPRPLFRAWRANAPIKHRTPPPNQTQIRSACGKCTTSSLRTPTKTSTRFT